MRRQTTVQRLDAVLVVVLNHASNFNTLAKLVRLKPRLLNRIDNPSRTESVLNIAMTDGDRKLLDILKRKGIVSQMNAYDELERGARYGAKPATLVWFAKNFCLTAAARNDNLVENMEEVSLDAAMVLACKFPLGINGLRRLAYHIGKEVLLVVEQLRQAASQPPEVIKAAKTQYPVLDGALTAVAQIAYPPERAEEMADGDFAEVARSVAELCWLNEHFPRDKYRGDLFGVLDGLSKFYRFRFRRDALFSTCPEGAPRIRLGAN